MKGKFVFHFKDGTKIIDRNGYNTLSQARSWASAHNRGVKEPGDKIIKITERTPPKIKKKPTSRFGVKINFPKFKL